jgi:rubrerythrin
MAGHRKILSDILGIEAIQDMEVHHIDGNRFNNNPVNLIALTRKEHIEVHKRLRAQGIKSHSHRIIIKLHEHTCKLCGYTWQSKKETPIACPKCKRYDYNIDKKKD